MSSEEMNAALYDGRGGLRRQTVPMPKLVPGGALLRVKACGIAISDLRAYKAGASLQRAYKTTMVPRLLHKLAGEIAQVAPEVTGIEVGDRVYITGYYHCGECSSCRRGFTNLCEKRTWFYDERIALSEYVVLPPKSLQTGGATKVGKHVSFGDATHVGPLSNCLNTLRAVDFAPGDSAVVLGAGPMGLLHVLLLRAFGASKIIVLDVDEFRLEKSKEFGADYVINARTVDAVAEVKRLADGGADVVIVATGRPDAMLSSLNMVRSRGRIDFFGGIALEPGDATFKLDPNPVHYKELKIVGSYGSLPDDYRVAAELMTSGRISPSRLDTHHFDFEHLEDALLAEKDPRALRVLIEL